MVAASEIIGVMNVDGLNYDVCVRNTFVHVAERPMKRRMSAPAALAVLNFDTTVAQNLADGHTSSFDDRDSLNEACESNALDPWDECPSSLNTSFSQDTDDGIVYSLDDYDSDGETCDSNFDDSWDEGPRSLKTSSNLKNAVAPREMRDEAGVASVTTDGRQCDWNMQTSVRDSAFASEGCGHRIKRLPVPEQRNSFVDGGSCKVQAAALKSTGRRGSAKSKAITRMFIGNLPCSMSTDRMVVELCKHGFFGTYTSVNVPRKADGIGRGFGFVRFCNAEEAQRFASVFRGCEYEGKRCYVNPAARQSNPSIP
eukprot:TRINITY_DN4661_c0_g2_i4.p1 TRINITY_DN4661_c0_g2~~TRINITY_DN4661_c0_g2_i4.p1  ORF type:complete len:336 (-),score=48.39 TRINITY_DN4661_c0_g2_i4:529-1464(-)